MKIIPSPLFMWLAVCLAFWVAPIDVFDGRLGTHQAFAQTSEGAEKEAFEAAKELGTVEAWDAFLSSYSTGFHADLARAYKKKLSDAASTPAAAATAPASANSNDFPIAAGTWGGIVRDGPGMNFKKQDSLSEGDNVSLMGVSPELDNGYPWFKIWYGPEQTKGYMWGGIICARGTERTDVYKTCTTTNADAKHCDGRKVFVEETGRCVDLEAQEDGQNELNDGRRSEKKSRKAKEAQKRNTLVCAANYKLRNGECVLIQNCGNNAYRSAEGDCYCNKNYEMRNGSCAWKQDKQGFEVAPWKKTGCKAWQAQCSQGSNKACGQYEANCQVN